MTYSDVTSRALVHRGHQKRRQPIPGEGAESVPSQRGPRLSSPSQSGRPLELQSSNLRSFIAGTTPSVGLQYLSKTNLWGTSPGLARQWKAAETGVFPYFTLGDLVDSFSEWSAYGAGVPLRISQEETVVQYYVPYLSAIQLFVRPGVHTSALLRRCDDSDASDSDFRDSSSDGSDCDADRICRQLGTLNVLPGVFGSDTSSDSGSSRDLGTRLSRSSSGAELMDEVEGGHGDGSCQNWFRCRDCGDNPMLLFEYFENASPHSRVPLADKVAELESECSILRTLKSIELHPTSWLSVAWYPIYRIPTGPTLRDLAASFLTYHSLSSPMPDCCRNCRSRFWIAPGGLAPPSCVVKVAAPSHPWLRPLEAGQHNQDLPLPGSASLPAFGLATYKMKGPVWNTYGQERNFLNALLSGADLWLKDLQIHHPDHDFFSRR